MITLLNNQKFHYKILNLLKIEFDPNKNNLYKLH